MIAIKRFTRAELEEIAREQYRARYTDRGRPEVRNGRAVLMLAEPERLYYRGRAYEVRPVPYTAGIRLLEMQERFRAFAEAPPTAESVREYARLCREATRLFRRLVRPYGVRRLIWPLCRNPFRDATEAEIGGLVGFFSMHRTRSSVRPFPSPSGS